MFSKYMLLSSTAIAMVTALTTPTPTSTLNSVATQVVREAATITPSASTSQAVYFISTEHITIPGVTNDHVTIPGKTIDIAIPTCIQTITPDANGYLPPGTCNALWDYYPNFSAAVVFAILFGILTIVHICQAIMTRKRFCWVIVMACVWETCAFTFRAISTRFQQSVGVYLVFQIFILLAPLWVNAFDYMVLGRMIYFFAPTRSLFSMPASTIAAAFVSLDFISFIIQLVGGSMSGPTSSAKDQLKAIHIYMFGIGLQEIFILIFVGVALNFQREMSRLVNYEKDDGGRKGWRRLLYTLYFTLGMITIRILFRLVEFSRGSNVSNPLLTSEAYFYVLEAVPMFLAILSLNITHPGTILVGVESEMPGFFATLKAMYPRKSFVKVGSGNDGQELLQRV
ncbi:hypothetical protein BP6252_07320 [Coleophoma cylindrospora]|uniref:RTA1-domain-containing protein n=1 Tax=Coleophoma cylindrospora TaxID=1849047 RepID=A0A3D8RH79_9HELO|nr:hypothetical protein BP6252_07320 [Coleophoma cylindrospora]